MKFGFLNLLGFSIVVIMLLPNVIYAIRFRDTQNRCMNRAIHVIEQTGRYASIVLMVLPLGVWEFGFPSVAAMLAYLFGNGILLLTYLVIWVLYFRKQSFHKAMALAIIPVGIFLLNGLTLCHWLLVVAAVVFGIGHIWITWQNNKL